MVNDKQLLKSFDNCWDLFDKSPQNIKSRIIATGTIAVIQSNFTNDETKYFMQTMFGYMQEVGSGRTKANKV
jgi:hypothetical protein